MPFRSLLVGVTIEYKVRGRRYGDFRGLVGLEKAAERKERYVRKDVGKKQQQHVTPLQDPEVEVEVEVGFSTRRTNRSSRS